MSEKQPADGAQPTAVVVGVGHLTEGEVLGEAARREVPSSTRARPRA